MTEKAAWSWTFARSRQHILNDMMDTAIVCDVEGPRAGQDVLLADAPEWVHEVHEERLKALDEKAENHEEELEDIATQLEMLHEQVEQQLINVFMNDFEDEEMCEVDQTISVSALCGERC